MVIKAQTLGKFQELPTRPLECWGKMKDFRRKYFHHSWRAKERGDALYMGAGGTSIMQCLPAGLGDVGYLAHGLYFARLMRDPEQAIRVHEAADGRGFSRDLCSTLRLGLGQQFLGMINRSPSGEYVMPDFVLEQVTCIAQTKCSRALADHLGIPLLAFDIPVITDRSDKQQVHRAVGFLAEQANEIIRRMEKVTGRKYDDERLIEGVYNEWEAAVLYGKICLLQRNVPAPLDDRMLESLNAGLVVAGKYRRETVELLRDFLAETEQRVKDGISALGIERCRLIHEGQPMYYNIRFYRYPSLYGAVFLGGRFIFTQQGAYNVGQDGSWGPAQTLQERGITLRNREDALRHLAELVVRCMPCGWDHDTPFKIKEYLKVAQDWQAQGVVFHLDLGCKLISSGLMEARNFLHKMDFPTMVYEASSSDPRDFTPSQVFDRIDAFLESLGLTKLAPSLEALKGEES